MTHFLRLLFAGLFLLSCNVTFSQNQSIVRIRYGNPELINTIRSWGMEIVDIDKNVHIDLMATPEQLRLLQDQKLDPVIRTTREYLTENLVEGLRLEGYHTYDEILAILQDYATTHPDICVLHDIGNSLGKLYFEAGYPAYEAYQHEIWALKISDNPELDEDEPTLLYDAVHHAREPIGVEVVLNFTEHLFSNYGVDPAITNAIDNNQIWIVPLVNPDGYKLVMDSLEIWWRKTIRDNNGNHQIDPFLPDWIEPDGVDPNRNYGIYWGGDWNSAPWFRETYRGPYSFSEPCSQAMGNLMAQHHFVTELSYHSYGEKFLYPWAHNTQNYLTPDHLLYETLANELALMTPRLASGYYFQTTVGSITLLTGCTMDYAYGRHGIISYSVELAQDFIPDPSDIEPVCVANLASQLYLLERVHERILTSHVKDANTDDPVVAMIFIEGIDNIPNGRYEYKCDADYGRFYRLLNPGDYQVRFSAFGYETQEFEDININESGATELEVLLEPASPFVLTGMVKDQDGYAIANAEVVVGNIPVDTVWTDGDGYFNFDPFYAGTYDIEVAADQFYTFHETFEIDPDQNNLSVGLTPYDVIGFEDEDALDNFNMTGFQTWSRTIEESFAGEFSLVTPVMSTNQHSAISIKLCFDTDIFMTLATKVSFDSVAQGMIFTMDEHILKTYTWDNDWVCDTFFIPQGMHQFKWAISRGYQIPSPGFENKAWIDEIDFYNPYTGLSENINISLSAFDCFPNPSQNSFSFSGDERLDHIYFAGVFDVSGRLIRILDHSQLSDQQLLWDGTNGNGLPVKDGIYFVKIATKNGVWVEKLIKQK
nr:carboxypeptidase regulatory-like domain-containing protein [Bacteroidota bacterium]